MEPTPTHIILEYPKHKTEVLFRAVDGVGMAQRKDTLVIIGEDPNKGTARVFIDGQAAHKFISELLPALDLVGVEMDFKLSLHEARAKLKPDSPAAKVEYRAGEGLIAIPTDAVINGQLSQVADLPRTIRKIN